MLLSIDKNLVNENEIPDFMSDEKRSFFSDKLLEVEKYNMEHLEFMTSEELHKTIKEKYGI